MAVNDIYRMAVEGIGPNGQELVNVFHYRQEGLGGDDAGEELINAWQEDVQALFLDCFSASVALVNISVRNLTQPTLGTDRPVSPAEPGSISGDSLPPTSAAVITWLTGLIGRRHRGRTYIWPAGESSQTGGQISGGYDTTLGLFAAAALSIQEGTLGSIYTMVVHSEVDDGADTPVTIYRVNQFLATQRRRRVGVGA